MFLLSSRNIPLFLLHFPLTKHTRGTLRRYGRKREKQTREAELAPFYELEDDAEEEAAVPARARRGGGGGVLGAEEASRLEKLNALARGEGDGSSSSEDGSDDEDDDAAAESEDEALEAWDAKLPATFEEVADEASFDGTRRLAITDQDWSHVRRRRFFPLGTHCSKIASPCPCYVPWGARRARQYRFAPVSSRRCVGARARPARRDAVALPAGQATPASSSSRQISPDIN